MFLQVISNLYPLLAQAGPPKSCDVKDFQSVIEEVEISYEGVSKGWDNMWNFIFTTSGATGLDNGFESYNSLYAILSFVGQILAVGTLLFFMMQWFKDINEGNVSRPISELLWPLLAAFLLGFSSLPGIVFNNSINPLGSVIYGLRQEYLTWEDGLYNLPGIVGPESIKDSFRIANAVVNTQGIVQNFVARCPGIDNQQDPKKKGCTCYEIERARSIKLIEGYQDHFEAPDVMWWKQRLENLKNNVSDEELQNALQPGGELAWARSNPGRSENQNFLSAIQVSFRQTLEIALLFTAMLGPVAIGVSLLPVPIAQKSIVTWLSGLGAVGSAKFFFFIIVGITSQVLLNLNNPPVDLSWFAIFMNTIAPLLSMGLASGGGAALFSSLNNLIIFSR